MAKKWEIDNLDNKTFEESAKIILTNRIANLLSAVNKYFQKETVENLHDTRIALRRVRYNMELFTSCFDKKKFLIFYKRIEYLQDFSGKIRDFDVLSQNLNSLREEKIKVTKNIFKRLGEERENLNDNLKLELMKFTHSKALSNFQKLLS